MTEDAQLLRGYAEQGSEAAFRELVARHMDLVYSTALRLTDGNACLAQDAVQEVFTDLARDAKSVSSRFILGGWLYRHSCFVASKMMRSERRRQAREQAAATMNPQDVQPREGALWQQLAPVLDQAMSQLNQADRDAIVLRFFQNKDLRQVGAVIGVSEDTAQKRVSRALEKLRQVLLKRGVISTTTALVAVLAAYAVTAAPAGVAASVSSAALAAVAAGNGLTLTLLELMATAKLQIVASAVVVAGLGTTLVLEQHALSKLSEKNQALQARLDSLALIAQDNQRLSNVLAQAATKSCLSADEFAELLKLRGQVGLTRRLAQESPKLRAENTKLREASKVVNAPPPKKPDDPAEAEFQKETERRVVHARVSGLTFLMYANENKDKSPDTWAQIADRIPAEDREFITNNFEIVYHGQLGSSETGGKILFREKQARHSPKGDWVRTYAFASGETETHSEPDGNFDAWESLH